MCQDVSKSHLLDEMLSSNKISKWWQGSVLRFTKFPIGNTTMLNLQVTKYAYWQYSHALHLGRPLFDRPVARHVYYMWKIWKDLPKDDLTTVQGQAQAKPKTHFGLTFRWWDQPIVYSSKFYFGRIWNARLQWWWGYWMKTSCTRS